MSYQKTVLDTTNVFYQYCFLFHYISRFLNYVVVNIRLRFAFLLFDENNHGVITKSELIKVLKANHMAKSEAEVMRKAETIMSQADKRGDGVISFDEFVNVSKKFPNILFPVYQRKNY